MEINEAIEKTQLALDQRVTDQELAEQCPTLTPEDIHTIRLADDLSVLPFAAIVELSQLGEQHEKDVILASPLQSREYELFQERLKEAFLAFQQYQTEHFQSEDSRMDDLIIANLANQMQQDCFQNEELMLQYFTQYQAELENI